MILNVRHAHSTLIEDLRPSDFPLSRDRLKSVNYMEIIKNE